MKPSTYLPLVHNNKYNRNHFQEVEKYYIKTDTKTNRMARELKPNQAHHTNRKLYTFMITKRLSHTLASQTILTGLNWVSLPGSQTIFPIITMRNLIEDAMDRNRTLWILLQDIKCTFDSVSLQFLIKTLHRL